MSPRVHAGNSWAAKVRGDGSHSDSNLAEIAIEKPIVPRLKLDEIDEDLEDPMKTPENVPAGGETFDRWDDRHEFGLNQGCWDEKSFFVRLSS